MQRQKLILTEFTLTELSDAIISNILEAIVPLLPAAVNSSISPPKEEKYFTRKEVAKKLKISLPTLDKYTRSGKIPGYRLASGQIRYLEADIENALNKIKTRN